MPLARERTERSERMPSMRLYGKLVAFENRELAGTHCVVQWEEGDPRSIVEKCMTEFSGIGEACKVRVTEKAKTPAKLVACVCGKSQHFNPLIYM